MVLRFDNYHVRKRKQDKDERLQLAPKQPLKMLETSKKVLDDILRMITMAHRRTSLNIHRNQILRRQSRWGLLVELGNRMQHIDSFLVAASTDEEFRRFVEVEDEVAQEEDHEGHAAEDDHFVAPAHVVLDAAAGDAGGDGLAGGEGGVGTVLCGCTVGDAGGGDDTDGLPDGEKRNQVTTALRQELERDCGVDGDVTTETEGGEKVDSADGAVVVHRRSEEQTEDGRDQAGEVEGPATTDDVDGETPK